MATGLYTAAPFLSRFQGKSSGLSTNLGGISGNPCGWTGNFIFMVELRKKILTFRDIIDLPPCDGSSPISELVKGTVEDLHKLYPNVVPYNVLAPETENISIDHELALLYKALKAIGDSWAKNHKWINNWGHNAGDCLENMISLEQLGGKVLAELRYMTDIAKEMFDVMDEDDKSNNEGRVQSSTIGDILIESYSDNKRLSCPSPNTPTSASPELSSFGMELSEFSHDASSSQSLLLPFRLKALENLKPVGMKHLFSFDMSPSLVTHDSSHLIEINKKEAQQVAEESPLQSNYEEMTDLKDTKNSIKFTNNTSNSIPDHQPIALAAATSPSPSTLPSPPPPPPPPVLPSNPLSIKPVVAPPSPPCGPPLGVAAARPVLAPIRSNAPLPPPPMAPTKGAMPPPPPPLGASKALRPKKAATKLKRSSHMGSLYRTLKGKVEGSSLSGKQQGKKSKVGGGPAGGKQGMADALAEMTKRSAYFQQIEDVQKHSKSIMEIKAAINSFQSKDMSELIKFHKYVEQHLEKLTDETQVLARFEGFPSKKLESLRSAAALHLKLEDMVNNLEKWKVAPPLGQLLDKVESFFTKVKGEIDALERSKDEEAKKFQSHNITFDFNILILIKECMVDVSSSCMELALEEKRKVKAKESGENGRSSSSKGDQEQGKAHTKMLWKAFQFAFRVYSFAGGQDDRADMLTKQLAHEIEIDPF
ncbi:uncharacterized protein At4g04980-like [Humulus lupulus]|uniref:uncharacterized protein At4g04980-like n=1 Tax=Humulus lupulus TaxID=3486 RepID=UPI002B40182A|nr:uncharacterized protein At4g04980-like [Humulus lupulus]